MGIKIQRSLKFRTGIASRIFLSTFVVLTGVALSLLYVQLASQVKALGQVYIVTNTNDAGPGSLRQAITDANANSTLLNGEPHNIQFNISRGWCADYLPSDCSARYY